MQALVVDDSFLMRTVLSGILVEMGFDTIPAKDGFEALTLLEKGPKPNLILLDLYMPNMTGLEVLAQVRAQPRFAGIPVVMVSGESDPGMKSWALQCGANAYLTRPFNADTVADVLIALKVYNDVDRELVYSR